MSWRFGAALFGFVVASAACSSAESTASGCAWSPTFSPEPAELIIEPIGPPRWTMTSDEATFSSPNLADLTGDGVLDIVQGFGQDTLGARSSSVIATDGATGAELWRSSGHDDLIGTARFADLGGDSTLDVVIGGRRGALVAVDGANGRVLWSFDDQNGRWFNFYTSQFVDDQDGDGVKDVVAANGGLVFDEPREGGGVPDPDRRSLGTTFVISGADGSVISSLPAPDRREQYMSPIVVPSVGSDEDGSVDVLIGTGGETLPGSLWRMPLEGLVGEDRDSASELGSGGEKGIIATPSVAHLTDDCVLDFVLPSFGGRLSAIDGATDSELWAIDNPDFETYSTPTLGYFVGDDDVADVFVGMARGVWPDYQSSDYLLVDGATGAVVWRETRGTFAPSGFVAADVNGDGRDEVVFGVNDLDDNTHRLYVLDTSRLEARPLIGPLNQTTFSSPWLGDMDGDGRLDLIATESAYQSGGPAKVYRFDVGWSVPTSIRWGGYLGTSGTGVIETDPVPSG